MDLVTRMTTVAALIHGKPGSYGISFPDFPGCVSGGDTIEEAITRGREGLATHIEAMIEEGYPLPPVSSIDDIRSNPEFADDLADAVALVAVDQDIPGKSVRVNISIDEQLLKRIDRVAQSQGESRSGFLAAAARTRLGS
jgi:predicted RNase H-like HicB family nuclease